MRAGLAGALTLALAAAGARADDFVWRPAGAHQAPAVTVTQSAPAPMPAVSLGRPVALDQAHVAAGTQEAFSDPQLTPTSFTVVTLEPPRPVVRAQAPAYPDPMLAPPPPPAPPPGGTGEAYNSGVTTPPPSHPLLGKAEEWLGLGHAAGPGRAAFQSDHCFDTFVSPVTNPFLFEDPRALTEIRPIFIQQGTPLGNSIFRGGDIEFFGLQARLAVTDRLSFVLNKAGITWFEPHNPADGFDTHDGFSEVWFGPKYTFWRNEQTGTLAAAGLTFQIPAGSASVFQDTGTLSLEPYISFGQNFLRSSYGSFNFLNTTGYDLGLDSQRTDYLFSSFHLDYDVYNIHHIYPLVEMNWFHYTSAGNAHNLDFEGRDLANLGASGVGGHDTLTIATGARFKLNEAVQTGIAAEFPLAGHKDLLDYRVTFDLIFRY